MLPGLKLPPWLNFGIAFPLIFLNSWLILLLCQYLQPIPSIVLTASLAAFLLDFPIGLLEQRRMSRGAAIAIVLLSALTIFTITSLFLGPLVFEQLVEFANRLPVWIEQGRNQLQTLNEQTVLHNLPFDLSELTTQLTNQISTALQSLTSRLISLTLDTINSTVNLLVSIVLTILLVINGQSLWHGLLSWLPLEWSTRIRASLQPSFRGYFTGQAIIALILGIALSVTFGALKVPFGLLFGLAIGVTSIIPFGGTLSIALVSGLLAFQDVWLGVRVLVAALVVGQINDNVIAPRLIGGITGLNPATVVVALLVGAKIGGFLGLILAVPTASFLKRIADTSRLPDLAEATETPPSQPTTPQA